MSKPRGRLEYRTLDRKGSGASILDAYNDIAVGIDILYREAESGNCTAARRLKILANQTFLFAGSCKNGEKKASG